MALVGTSVSSSSVAPAAMVTDPAPFTTAAAPVRLIAITIDASQFWIIRPFRPALAATTCALTLLSAVLRLVGIFRVNALMSRSPQRHLLDLRETGRIPRFLPLR